MGGGRWAEVGLARLTVREREEDRSAAADIKIPKRLRQSKSGRQEGWKGERERESERG